MYISPNIYRSLFSPALHLYILSYLTSITHIHSVVTSTSTNIMQLNTLVATVLGLVSSIVVHAAPATTNTVGGVLMCNGINYTGDCEFFLEPVNACANLTSDWDQQVSSFRPDNGTCCSVYGTQNCFSMSPGGTLRIAYPGASNMSNTAWGDVNDWMRSLWCGPINKDGTC